MWFSVGGAFSMTLFLFVVVFGIIFLAWDWFCKTMQKMQDKDHIDYVENDTREYTGDNVMFDPYNMPVDWMDKGSGENKRSSSNPDYLVKNDGSLIDYRTVGRPEGAHKWRRGK